MNEDILASLDPISDELIEEAIREQEQRRKQIESYLRRKTYTGYIVEAHGGNIFIFNKTKTPKEQLKWLKKYSEVLRSYGIDAEVYDDRQKPYICF